MHVLVFIRIALDLNKVDGQTIHKKIVCCFAYPNI